MATGETLERLWEMVEPLAASLGLEVVDIELRHEGSAGRVLRVYLDRAGNHEEGDEGYGEDERRGEDERDEWHEGDEADAPGLDDLSRVSRELSDLLDVYDVVEGSYTLEVSSPGVNRPLRKPEHFARFVGQKVRVRTGEMIDGRRKFVGPLSTAAGDGVVVLQDGREVFIPFTAIVKANIEYEWASP